MKWKGTWSTCSWKLTESMPSPDKARFYHQICSSKFSVSGSRVSNEPIMNPDGQRGSKSLVNLMRIGQWTFGSQMTEDEKYVPLYIIEECYHDELVFHTNQPRNENCDDFDLEMALCKLLPCG